VTIPGQPGPQDRPSPRVRVLVTGAGGPAALAAARESFAAAGIGLLLASAAALEIILDKLALARYCADVVRVPRTEAFGPAVDPADWSYPVIVKPRTGSGSSGLALVGSAAELAALNRSPGLDEAI
jgi:carbamoyl-phosphate synthase large subunit